MDKYASFWNTVTKEASGELGERLNPPPQIDVDRLKDINPHHLQTIADELWQAAWEEHSKGGQLHMTPKDGVKPFLIDEEDGTPIAPEACEHPRCRHLISGVNTLDKLRHALLND